MAPDWEKLAGEQGRTMTSSRLGRLWRVGTMGASVAASTAARQLTRSWSGSDEMALLRDSRFRRAQAEKVLKVLGELKGATMKVGQILSSDPELVPPEFADALSALQRDAPPMTYSVVKAELERAFDCPMEAIFERFDPEPIGAASIGQVHRATLRTGEDVAVKLQYPGIVETLESDLKNLTSLLTLARLVTDKERVSAYTEEVKRALSQEMDYVGEGERTARFHAILEPLPDVRAPKPIPEWTRKNVLTMEYIEGEKLDDALESMEPGPERAHLLERLVDLYSWMLHDLHELHADPHPGNFILSPDNEIVVLDFGCIKRCDARFADGILDIIDACWQDDYERVSRLYRKLGFGGDSAPDSIFAPDLLKEYHSFVLAPFLTDGPFDFATWGLKDQTHAFFMKHPSFLKLVPPSEGLLIFRVMGGLKGLMAKMEARVNVHEMAVDIARRRGRLTATPKPSTLRPPG